MKDNEARNFINIIFEEYERLKDNGALYVEDDIVPKGIISAYYKYITVSDYDNIINRFKNKYISNESELEEARRCEKAGLGEIYDYIKNFNDFDKLENINYYWIIIKELHRLLFSKCPHPEFGGQFRATGAYIKSFAVDVSQTSEIYRRLDKIFNSMVKYMQDVAEIKKSEGPDINIIEYINKCIRYKCEIIKTHPFDDGNKRTSRGLMNLLFKNVGLPPVYVSYEEKNVYFNALEKALLNDDFNELYTFYYYKICDSIYELDVKPHKENKGIQKTKK
ncbi:MAG TPA: Fic family protein [Bacilli bacterium]|nr:Fic family protein [Bacilli bacterium]